MYEKEITPYQNLFIIIVISFGFQSMLMPIILSAVKGPIGWISIIIGALILYLTIRPINQVMNKYKGDTIVGIAGRMFPKYISKLIGFYYIVLFIIANSWLMKDFGEQIKYLMLFNTPISIIIIAILLVASYAAKKGIQSIAQIANITILIAFIPYIAVIIFSTYYSDYTNVLPMFPVDIEGIVNAVPNTIFGFFGFSILMFSNSYVVPTERNMILNKRFIIISMMIYILSYILIVIKFGMDEATKLVWPFLSVMKFVNIPGFFFESTEIVGMSFQIIVTFTCICILMHFTNLVLEETLDTRESGYFVFIQIPILYITASILPGMYMLYPYIKIPAYIFSALNLLIPLLIIYKDRKKNKATN
ncbi:MAG: endospore germination permease [Tissierellia bacterium]|nr:endospore germination permease [Tissierellia bacterium]